VSVPAAQVLASRYAGWIALAAGAACSLAFAPAGLYPLAVACPLVLLLLWEGAAPRRAAWLGLAYGAGLFFAGTYWIYTAVHVFGKAPIWLALFLMAGLVAIMSAWYALLGWLVARYVPRPSLLRWLVAVPAAWTLVEWLRGWVLSGFPWLEVGYAHSDSPLAGFAPLGGVHLVTWVSMLTAGAALALLRGTQKDKAAAAVIAVVAWTVGAGLWGRAWTRPAGEPVSVAIVQPAIPQDLKWEDSHRDETLALFRRMTEDAFGARLIVWPEAALPMLAHEAGPWLARMWEDAQRHGSDLMLGLLRYDADGKRYYNGLLALSGDEAGWYYKRRLVPFGEFFPVPAFVRSWMRLMSLTYVDMTPGDDDQPPVDAAGQKVGVTICYEDAYGAEQLAVLEQATLLVNVTNNAWFGDSTAPHQQLQMARFRALEAGRFLARATSNGISAIIGPDGEVLGRAAQFVPEVLKGSVTPLGGLTPYARTGNWPVLLGCALLAGAAFGRGRRLAPKRTG
jgi:apolipoprotein N-acyltransferase